MGLSQVPDNSIAVCVRPVGDGAGGWRRGIGPVTVPLFTQSTATGSITRVRVINHSTKAGTVSILAYDDGGRRHGPATLELGGGEAVHFDAGDLEGGNAGKGLRGGIGTGEGAWRLS